MIKVFISMPMNGRTEDEIRKEAATFFELYKHNNGLSTDECSLISPCAESFEPLKHDVKHTRLGYLARSLGALADCDRCVFVPGWSKAKGCIIEFLVCVCYGIPIIQIDPLIVDELKGTELANIDPDNWF